jgi:hypothetical protein
MIPTAGYVARNDDDDDEQWRSRAGAYPPFESIAPPLPSTAVNVSDRTVETVVINVCGGENVNRKKNKE